MARGRWGGCRERARPGCSGGSTHGIRRPLLRGGSAGGSAWRGCRLRTAAPKQLECTRAAGPAAAHAIPHRSQGDSLPPTHCAALHISCMRPPRRARGCPSAARLQVAGIDCQTVSVPGNPARDRPRARISPIQSFDEAPLIEPVRTYVSLVAEGARWNRLCYPSHRRPRAALTLARSKRIEGQGSSRQKTRPDQRGKCSASNAKRKTCRLRLPGVSSSVRLKLRRAL